MTERTRLQLLQQVKIAVLYFISEAYRYSSQHLYPREKNMKSVCGQTASVCNTSPSRLCPHGCSNRASLRNSLTRHMQAEEKKTQRVKEHYCKHRRKGQVAGSSYFTRTRSDTWEEWLCVSADIYI